MGKASLVAWPIALLALAAPLATAASDGAVEEDWWSRVQRDIAHSEYEITWQERTVLADLDRAWQAPNRAHDLRTYFTDEGIRVVRRTESEPSWEWSLSLIGYGRGERVSSAGPATLSPRENRIDYDRGPIVEWYVNDRRGLKQGFTLAMPIEEMAATSGTTGKIVGLPGGRPPRRGAPGDGRPAFLVLVLTGSLSPVISADGQAIDFRAPSGAYVLRYAELHVTDATGQALPAWLEGFAEAGVRGLRIVFDDRDAAYPVTVDPLATSASWTAESDQDTARFGISASTAGDVNADGYSDVIVGAHLYDNDDPSGGRAYVYHGSAAGLSTTASWTAQGGQYSATLGYSVSTAGDVNGDGYADVIVGAWAYDNGGDAEGRAFLYYGNDGSGVSLAPRQSRADGTAPIGSLGMSDSPDSFQLAVLGRIPYGRGRVRLEYEVEPLGTLFDGNGTVITGTWTDAGTTGTEQSELASGLTIGERYH